jgi:hypothetical protein
MFAIINDKNLCLPHRLAKKRYKDFVAILRLLLAVYDFLLTVLIGYPKNLQIVQLDRSAPSEIVNHHPQHDLDFIRDFICNSASEISFVSKHDASLNLNSHAAGSYHPRPQDFSL